VTPPGGGPYNPLDKLNIAKSIEGELLSSPVLSLADIGKIAGAGVYVIYYAGPFEAYESVTARNKDDQFSQPIYIGKAIPKGGRKGGLTKDASKGTALADRLRQHAASIKEANNLELADFWFRHLVVDDIWIPLGENMLIETFQPVWNRAIDGFGNKAPGRRRKNQYRSPWDVLHPGRKFAEDLADSGVTQEFLLERVSDYFAGRKLKKLPKKLVEQIEAEEQEELAEADELPLA
jgi:hypothetical protein